MTVDKAQPTIVTTDDGRVIVVEHERPVAALIDPLIALEWDRRQLEARQRKAAERWL